MTDAELFACFDHEYSGEGYPKLDVPREGMKSEKHYFTRHCQLNCVTDIDVIESLWKEHKAKQAAKKLADIEARKKKSKR